MNDTNRFENTWYRGRLPILITVIAGILLSFIAFNTTRQLLSNELLLKLQEDADYRVAAIHGEIQTTINVMHGVIALQAASTKVDTNEFITYVNINRGSVTGIESIAWITRISSAERQSYKMSRREDGLTDFRIYELTPDGTPAEAGQREEYYVLHHIDSDKHKFLQKGLDLLSHALFSESLTQARDHNQSIVSVLPHNALNQEQSSDVLIVLPKYKSGTTSATVEERRRNLEGFVLAMINIGALTESAYTRNISNVSGIDVYIFGQPSATGRDLLYFHPSRSRQQLISAESWDTLRNQVHIRSNLKVANQTWEVIFAPIPGFFDQANMTTAYIALVGGLIITTMLAFLLRGLINRRFEVERLVNERTRKLHESESRVRATVDNVIDGIITIDPLGIVKDFNPAAERLFGYQVSEVIGNNVNMLMPEPYRHEHDQYLSNYITTGNAKVIGIGREVIGLRKDKSQFPLELSVSEMMIDGRRMFTGIVRDISDRVDAQKELNRFKSTLDRTQDCVFMFEPASLKFFYANQGAVNQVEYSHDELMNMSPFDIKPEYSEKEFRAMIEPMMRGEKDNIQFETVHRSKSGKDIPVEIFLQYIAPAGESPRFVAIVRDIKERKRAENELQNTNEMRQAILDGANYSIISTDTRGVIQTFNTGAQRMLGYTEKEVVDKETPALIHDPDEVVEHSELLSAELGHEIKPGFDTFIAKARQGIPDENEWTYIRKDGSRLPVLLSVTSLHDQNGNITGFLGIASDITERKKIDTMKQEFISTVSHELRTPLTSIRGSLGLLTGGVAGELPEQAASLLEIALNNSERLLLLINDILDIEKIESGEISLKFKTVPLMELLDQSVIANKGYAQTHDVQFEITDRLDDAMIYADYDRLMQVMNNLLSNATKFSPVGSTVRITPSRQGDMLRVSVTDEGPGIPVEFQDSVFQKFAQADSSDTRKVGGTGLGLSITKALVAKHGGSIDFHTTLGRGTTFFFDLPEQKQGELLAAKPSSNKRRMLICEDDQDVASLLRIMVAQAGYDADIAASAEEAWQLLRINQYSLMTLDIMLPGEDGISLIRRIRAHEETSKFPIIVISAKADQAKKILSGSAIQVVDWLEKPIDQGRLITAVNTATAINSDSLPCILHVEDDPDICNLINVLLKKLAHVTSVTTVSDAINELQQKHYEAIILDVGLPGSSGLGLLDILHKEKINTPVIIYSAQENDLVTLEQVKATLIKGRTSNVELVDTIKELLK